MVEHGLHVGDVADAFGISPTAVKSWVQMYESGGAAALVPRRRKGGGGKGRSKAARVKRKAVIEKKAECEQYLPRAEGQPVLQIPENSS